MSMWKDNMNEEQKGQHPLVPRVLVVDDDPQLLRLYSRALGKNDRKYGVVAFDHPESALEAIGRIESLAVVLSDVQMPNMQGDELVTAARQLRPDITYFLMTGNPNEYKRLEGSGIARKVFEKPFDIKELEGMICRQLEMLELQEQLPLPALPEAGMQPVQQTRYASLTAARDLLRDYIVAQTVDGRYRGDVRWLDSFRMIDAEINGTEDPFLAALSERKK